MFVELHAQSAFTFLEGADQPEALAAEAARRGMPALALVDRDGVYGAPRFHRAAVSGRRAWRCASRDPCFGYRVGPGQESVHVYRRTVLSICVAVRSRRPYDG